MYESEDGTVTGSIDRNRLDQIDPKTDEAKAQLAALKAEAELGDRQSAEAADRAAEQSRAQDPTARDDDEAEQQSQREQQKDAERQQREADEKRAADEKAGQEQPADVKQLQAEAEANGVTVDKRWGPDRLRQEIDAAKAVQARKQR